MKVAKYYRVLYYTNYSSLIIAVEEVKRHLGHLDKACTRHHSVGGVSAPAEGSSHSTDQPRGKVHGQVKLATISSNQYLKVVPQARLSILILSKAYPSSDIP